LCIFASIGGVFMRIHVLHLTRRTRVCCLIRLSFSTLYVKKNNIYLWISAYRELIFLKTHACFPTYYLHAVRTACVRTIIKYTLLAYVSSGLSEFPVEGFYWAFFPWNPRTFRKQIVERAVIVVWLYWFYASAITF